MSGKFALSLVAVVLAALAAVQGAGARPLTTPRPATEYCREGECGEGDDPVKVCFQLKYNDCVRPRQACQDSCEQAFVDGCDAALTGPQARAACKSELVDRCAAACDGELGLAVDAAPSEGGLRACLMIDQWVCVAVQP